MKFWKLAVATVLATACADAADDGTLHRDAAAKVALAEEGAHGPAGHLQTASEAGERDLGAIQAAVLSFTDSVDRQLRRVPNLTRDELAKLRRDVNQIHIDRARQLGVRVVGDAESLASNQRLVRLPDTTAHWIVRELDFSMPYVTPDAQTMLIEIGERFHARLDSLGVPRYRLDITSVLRTPDKQAELRRRNSNASRVESAHEFGTTVDLAYRRYAPPAEALPVQPHPSVEYSARLLADSMVVETGRLRGAELQAVLGRVLRDMQDEGKLLVRMERRQTVYHITVARRMPKREVAAAR